MTKPKFNLRNTVVIAICLAGMTMFASCEKQNNPEDNSRNANTTDIGAVINGVKWATRNVDAAGTFAATPESFGKFYQWNRKVAWAATGEITGWDSSLPAGTEWTKTNDPSPAGWRVPTLEEIQKLLDTEKVRNEWITQNGVDGQKFTDLVNNNSIFLPAAGYRGGSGGTLREEDDGFYWSSTQRNNRTDNAYGLFFNGGDANWEDDKHTNGFSVRCVAENSAVVNEISADKLQIIIEN